MNSPHSSLTLTLGQVFILFYFFTLFVTVCLNVCSTLVQEKRLASSVLTLKALTVEMNIILLL